MPLTMQSPRRPPLPCCSGQWLVASLNRLEPQLELSFANHRICTVIRFVRVSAKFGICTVVSVNETHVKAKMCTFTLESTHFIFNKCPIYTHDGASAKLSTNLQETDYSVFPFNIALSAGIYRKIKKI